MANTDWEPITQKITDEINLQPTESAKSRLLMGWRSQLEKEPQRLQAHQIDVIVREVRRRLNKTGR